MGEPALSFVPMTVAEFLKWESDDDLYYELIDGVPVAMAAPERPHRIIAINFSSAIHSALKIKPCCTVESEAGLPSTNSNYRYFQADIAVFCRDETYKQVDDYHPILVVEILSVSTSKKDRDIKLAEYQQMPTVKEIVFVDSRKVHVEVYSRLEGDFSWIMRIFRNLEDSFKLETTTCEIKVAELYDRVPLPEPGPSIERG